MTPSKQAVKNLKKRMIDRDHPTITSLAEAVGHPRSTVSRAVNRGQNAGVLAKIKAYLNAN